MGTRSTTIVMEGNRQLCQIYRQHDGYPEGHGIELAKLCDMPITNGISTANPILGELANGTGCLAAQIIAGLKTRPGGIYLEAPDGEIDDWVEYVYVVHGPAVAQTGRVTIECYTNVSGAYPFNIQTEESVIFPRSDPAEIIKRFAVTTPA